VTHALFRPLATQNPSVPAPHPPKHNEIDAVHPSRSRGGHALLICEGSDDGAEEHGGAEAGDEEAADVALVEAVLAVEVVHVGALQPVPSCAIRRGAAASVTKPTNQPSLRPPVQIWGGGAAARQRGFETRGMGEGEESGGGAYTS
jgi:hypothetical protein